MLNGLFNIGQSALTANQAWISVTGNNLANADTEGYSRQYVDQRDAGGSTPTGANRGWASTPSRSCVFLTPFWSAPTSRQATNSSRWNEHDTVMASLENIFNESNRRGRQLFLE